MLVIPAKAGIHFSPEQALHRDFDETLAVSGKARGAGGLPQGGWKGCRDNVS